MSETEHSLPPEVKNKAHGQLRVKIGKVVWIDPGLSASQLLLRIKFWGERGPGVILKPLGSPLEMVSNEVNYTIRCTQPGFISYLMDMGSLSLDVTDSSWRLLGTIKINLKLYLKKDPSSKLNLASNFGFSNIEVQGIFPVIFQTDPPKKIGEIELSIFSVFGEVFGKASEATETLLQENQKKVVKNSEVGVVNKKTEIVDFDNRIANSLIKDLAKDYNVSKIVSQEAENKETFKNYREERNLVKRFKEEKELPKEDLKSEPNQSMEWENLKNRAERLIRKVEASSNADYAVEPLQVKEEEFLIPSISELKALSFPQEIPVKAETQEKPFHELNSVTHLKLQISTMNLLIFRKDSNPFIECLIPLPALEGSRTDSFKISHKSLNTDTYLFNHESLHHLVVNDGVFSKLAPSTIKFKLLIYEKGKVVELGRGELQWEKILLAKGFVFNTDLEILTEESKARKSVQKIVAKLGVTCSLINEKKNGFSESQANENEKIRNLEASKSYLLYLYIDYITKLRLGYQNLYITYKTFPEPERINTDVMWGYKDSQPINHKMVTAVMASEAISQKLSSSNIVIEVWNKPTSGPDELLGMCKLPLLLFSSYIISGDALATSIYPIIAFDELKSITSLKTGEEIGFIKICLAMGSPLQVNKLRQNHENSMKVWIPEADPEEKIEKLKEDQKSEDQEKVEFVEKSIQFEEIKYEKDDLLAQSIESIGDIADLLNQRGKNNEGQGYDYRAKEEKPREFEKKPEESADFFNPNLQASENLFTPQVVLISAEEIIEHLKSSLEKENINLEEELKIADRFHYGYMHRESFTYFLQELRLGLTLSQINTFINHVLETKQSSNTRRLMFSDILSTLGLIQPLYLKHTFTITVSSIFACPLLNKLAGSQVYIKYLFPTESNFIESEMLEAGSTVQVNLKSVHSCTFPSASTLEECFSAQLEGISIFLCRYGAKGEERVVGKGILPIEEIIDLENANKMNRVICLYGDLSEQLGVLRNDLIGKIRVFVEYSQIFAYEAISASSELVFEKQTQVDRKIQRNQVLAVVLESFTEFSRGLKYLKSSGTIFSNKNRFRFGFSVFHEDQDLLKEYPSIDFTVVEVCDKLTINEVKYIELNLSNKSLEYFNHQTSLLTIFFDKELLGSCKIPLLQLLLHSSLRGEYAVLNEFGQFMGLVSLTLSFGFDEIHSKKPESPVHIPPPIAPSPPQVPTTKLLISVDSALNLPPDYNNEPLNSFIQFSWIDGKIYESKSILRSSCPCWNFYQELNLPLNIKHLHKPLIIELMHKSSRGSIRVGEASIDLEALINVKKIDGWYHVVDGNRQVGQLKVKLTSEEDLYFKLTGKVKQEVFDRLPSPKIIEKTVTSNFGQANNKYEERFKDYHKSLELAEDEDIFAKHYDNMRAIENLSRTLELRLSGSSERIEGIRRSPNRETLMKFVPVDLYKARSSPSQSILFEKNRKSREVSPVREPLYHSAFVHSTVRDAQADNYGSAFPLRKSRETSPLAEYYRTCDELERKNPSPPRAFESFTRTSPPRVHESYTRASPLRGVDSYSKLRETHKASPNYLENYCEFSSNLNRHKELSPSRPGRYEVNQSENVRKSYEASENKFYEHKFKYTENIEEEDDWDVDRIADVLKTIQEAAEISVDGGNNRESNYERMDSEFTLMDKGEKREWEDWRNENEDVKHEWVGRVREKSFEEREEQEEKDRKVDSENFEERRENLRMPVERIESVIENVNKRRMSPKISRPTLPKSLLSDPEISRIAAIMKGSK